MIVNIAFLLDSRNSVYYKGVGSLKISCYVIKLFFMVIVYLT